MEKGNCLNCGKEILYFPSNPRKFCSRKCKYEWKHRISLEIKKCPVCGRNFVRKRSLKQKYCSIECRGKARRIYKKCLNCGKFFWAKRKDAKFCSYDCSVTFRRAHMRKCIVCGKPIKSKNKKFCSYICMGIFYSDFYKGDRNPNWRGGLEKYDLEWEINKLIALKRDKFTCQLCGKTSCALQVHHIIPLSKAKNREEVKRLNSLDNLITLCLSCHNKLHPEKYLIPRIRDRYGRFR
jgi:predicted nucleic acid-binding Zn ribbon protein